jgi:hypothetical protein
MDGTRTRLFTTLVTDFSISKRWINKAEEVPLVVGISPNVNDLSPLYDCSRVYYHSSQTRLFTITTNTGRAQTRPANGHVSRFSWSLCHPSNDNFLLRRG